MLKYLGLFFLGLIPSAATSYFIITRAKNTFPFNLMGEFTADEPEGELEIGPITIRNPNDGTTTVVDPESGATTVSPGWPAEDSKSSQGSTVITSEPALYSGS